MLYCAYKFQIVTEIVCHAILHYVQYIFICKLIRSKFLSNGYYHLNRKLGEGAFGTVYGGEAYMNQLWTGVAVKTLRVGSNSEEKVRPYQSRIRVEL